MSSIVIRLVGGLGNQMFQYAAARALSIHTGVQLELDLSWFGTDPDRQYALSPFSIEANICGTQVQCRRGTGLFHRIMRRLEVFRETNGGQVFREASFRYDPRIEHIRPPVFLDGYYQTEKYFAPFRTEIAAEFVVRTQPTPAAAQILEQISATEAVCIHIRRGDYINNPAANAYHGTCSIEYYLAGLGCVIKDLTNPHCFVFSDDPKWVRNNFSPPVPMTLVDIHNTSQAHEDLRLMCACQHYIIANSSLSWWGAWLGSRERKIVVAPAQWFQSGKVDTMDLIPNNWIRI